ncbi:MAG: hypothetical protein JNK72_20195 [Myxococcales bacterium]|nr:hypothetical protein [Myxococcales bacterium]
MPNVRCEGACVDLDRSVAHCGACGRACQAGEGDLVGCVAGPCVTSCEAGYGWQGSRCSRTFAPAAVSPLAFARAGTRRPRFRWQPGSTGATRWSSVKTRPARASRKPSTSRRRASTPRRCRCRRALCSGGSVRSNRGNPRRWRVRRACTSSRPETATRPSRRSAPRA